MKLTKKRQSYIKQFKPARLVGKPLANPAGVEDRYAKELKKLTAKMVKEVEREIERLYKSPEAKTYFTEDASIASQARILMNSLQKKFDDMFGRSAQIIASRMVGQADKASKSALAASLKDISGGMTVKTDVMSADLRETVKASIAQNVALIKSIPSEYLTKVSGAVMRSVTSGQGMAELKPQIQKYGEMTDRRAKNIALDQTRKAYNSINADRMRRVGIQKFKWVHSGGGLHPRRDHQEMSGNIYGFDNLPIIDQNTGERGLPGQAPNCKCFMVPLIEFDDGTTSE